MTTSLISPLSFEECISRLESIKKQERRTFWGMYKPLRCDLSRISDTVHFFNLRKRVNPHAIFVIGKLYKVDEGTLITYEVADPSILDDLDDLAIEKLRIRERRLGKLIAIPIFLLLLLFVVYIGMHIPETNNFARLLTGILGFIVFSGFLIKLPQQHKDEKELTEFLLRTLNVVAKPT